MLTVEQLFELVLKPIQVVARLTDFVLQLVGPLLDVLTDLIAA